MATLTKEERVKLLSDDIIDVLGGTNEILETYKRLDLMNEFQKQRIESLLTDMNAISEKKKSHNGTNIICYTKDTIVYALFPSRFTYIADIWTATLSWRHLQAILIVFFVFGNLLAISFPHILAHNGLEMWIYLSFVLDSSATLCLWYNICAGMNMHLSIRLMKTFDFWFKFYNIIVSRVATSILSIHNYEYPYQKLFYMNWIVQTLFHITLVTHLSLVDAFRDFPVKLIYLVIFGFCFVASMFWIVMLMTWDDVYFYISFIDYHISIKGICLSSTANLVIFFMKQAFVMYEYYDEGKLMEYVQVDTKWVDGPKKKIDEIGVRVQSVSVTATAHDHCNNNNDNIDGSAQNSMELQRTNNSTDSVDVVIVYDNNDSVDIEDEPEFVNVGKCINDVN